VWFTLTQASETHWGEDNFWRARPIAASISASAHFERANSAGAGTVEELHETEYDERQYGAEDIEGHHRLFSYHARVVSPDEWGATIVGR
jgi:hypothetical protein